MPDESYYQRAKKALKPKKKKPKKEAAKKSGAVGLMNRNQLKQLKGTGDVD